LQAPFQPEGGAYGGLSQHQNHGDSGHHHE
jgi:hypothetical protein